MELSPEDNIFTVKQLKEALDGFDDHLPVIVDSYNSQGGYDDLHIKGVSLIKVMRYANHMDSDRLWMGGRGSHLSSSYGSWHLLISMDDDVIDSINSPSDS